MSPHDERQRARPERVGEHVRNIWNIARELVELLWARDVHDHRMRHGTPFDDIQTSQRARVRSVGAEPVHRFGRERDQPAGAQYVSGARHQ
jgi:hypothetical protein